MSRYRDTLDTALDQMASLIARVEDDDLPRPTPCADWTVADLIDHVVHSVTNLAVATRGEKPSYGAEPPHVDDREAAFAAAADQLREAWDHPADPDGDPRFNTGEIAVHSWDLATALGVDSATLDPRVAEDGLGFMSGALTPERRGSAFAPEKQPPAGAGPYEALAAFAGRTVSTH